MVEVVVVVTAIGKAALMMAGMEGEGTATRSDGMNIMQWYIFVLQFLNLWRNNF